MPHVETSEGIRIRYDERGSRDGRPLVLAHGFTVGLEMWFPQMHALSQVHRLITWDARGHGGSSAPDVAESYTMPGLARDLRGLLEALDAVDGAVIGGMSFGGMIALQYAVDYPDDVFALVLSDTTTRGPVQQIRRTTTPPEFAGDPGLEGGLYAMYTRPDLTPRLPDVRIPTLVLFGTEDDMMSDGIARLVDGLPLRRVVRLAGCVHGTSGQRPDAWNRAVLDFVRDVEAGAALGEDEVV
jgi:pimeloyl-ACP methyl ester carboxylesterase